MSKKDRFILDAEEQHAFDLSMLIDTRLLIQANSGGGKSYAVRKLLEATHGKVQHFILDPEGEYATLREQFDYVLAGKGGDTPADPRTAGLLAERLLELKASAILDLYELHQHERVLFVRNFLDALVNAKKELWHPALVVIDEAHKFCPQQGEAESAIAVSDLCTRGRKRGFCAVLATQRLSKLHKDAAAECNNKLIGRSSMDIDMKRAAEELGFSSKEQMLSLRKMQPGHFFMYGPALSREVTEIQIGRVSTTHPKAGASRKFKPPPPTAQIRQVLTELADLPEEMHQRERDEAELRKALAETRRKLTEALKAQPKPAPTVTKTIERLVMRDGQITRIEKVIQAAFVGLEKAFAGLKGLQLSIENMNVLAKGAPPARLVESDKRFSHRELGGYVRSHEEATARPTPIPREPPAGGLAKGEQRMLVAIAQSDGATRDQLSAVTGYKRSTRDQYLKKLIAGRLIDQQHGGFRLTPGGVAFLGSNYTPLPTGDALLQYWLGKLPVGESRILAAIAAAADTGKSLTKPELDRLVPFKRSTRDQYLKKLVSRRLVLDRGDGYSAADTLFG